MEDLDKEMVEIKIVIEGKAWKTESDGWVDHICVEMPTYPDLVKMYGAGSYNELRMIYLMNQQTWEIFYPHGDETPNEQKQQRRLINAFKEVVEETNGEVLKKGSSWVKPPNPKAWNEYWDKILHDTWSHNEYFDIVCEILYKKYPLEDHECHADPWAEPVVKTAEEMRDLIDKLDSYWKNHIRNLLKA